MTLAELRRAAQVAIAERVALRTKLSDMAHLQPEHRANLLGPEPSWAHYVMRLGEPVRGIVTADQVSRSLGTPANARRYAMAILEIADQMDEPDVNPDTGVPA